MRVSDEEHCVGDGVYSRCPKGNYDVVGHTPVSHPEDLLFAWVVHMSGSQLGGECGCCCVRPGAIMETHQHLLSILFPAQSA